MIIYSADIVECSHCGMEAKWEEWIDVGMVNLCEEIITCDHCGHTDLLAEGYKVYANYLKKCEERVQGGGWGKPNGLIGLAESHGGAQSTAIPATELSSEGLTEYSKWWDSLPPLD